jgi:prepilin peptidase CpaA
MRSPVDYFLQHYGLVIGFMSVLMTIGAVIDGWKKKVPNLVTLPTILFAWVWWLVVSVKSGDWGFFGTSFLATFAAGLPLLILWRIGFMGAGDVKLYAGFGAWMVPVPGFGFDNLMWAFAYSVLLGGVMGLAIIFWRGTPYVNIENAREALGDLANSNSLDQIREKALERKKRVELLPYGVPLTIGSLAYVVLLFGRWGNGL